MASPAEIQTFKVARETARRMMAAGEVSKEDQDDFLVWLRGHMGAYVQSCYSQDWRWSKDCEADRDEMSAWVRDDLNLDKYPAGLDVAEAWCSMAGWPCDETPAAEAGS